MNEIQARFDSDTAGHQMAVKLDQGLYRHLKFRAPGTGMYWFDLITWPGSLTIRGDMGTYVFAREDDMFAWFGGGRTINPQYWGEKVQAVDKNSPISSYCEEAFKQRVLEYVADSVLDRTPADRVSIIAHVTRTLLTNEYDLEHHEGLADISHEAGAREALDRYPGHLGWDLGETWEWTFDDYSAQFLWSCTAVLYGIREYRKHKSAALAEAG